MTQKKSETWTTAKTLDDKKIIAGLLRVQIETNENKIKRGNGDNKLAATNTILKGKLETINKEIAEMEGKEKQTAQKFGTGAQPFRASTCLSDGPMEDAGKSYPTIISACLND